MKPAIAIDVLVAFSREASEGDEPPRRVLERLAQALAGLGQLKGAVVVETSDQGEPVLVASVGFSLEADPEIESLDEELERWVLRAAGPGQTTTLPLVSAGGLFGAVVLLWSGSQPDRLELRLAEGLVDLAAVAVDRAHRTRALRETLSELRASKESLARREKLEALGEMAAVVAHEVKNPLASISGALQVLGQRMPSDSTEGKVVDMALQRLRDLASMVDELLTFARPRSPTLTRVAVRSFLDGVCGLLQANPQWSELELQVSIEPADAQLLVDAGQLQGVLLNLLLNGAQAMEGRGTLALSVCVTSEDARIEVLDQGPGVPAHVRDRIFDPFVTTKIRGSGLGLAVARQVVEAHQGHIELEHPEAGGARFVITLPA
ncbi:MAG: hypothetical protein EA397_07590 [Deltaproteobacteria bacterium]|nr:MAG: hypothetical protein EA397_07590 [Deltaproteobacteria bacterium]